MKSYVKIMTKNKATNNNYVLWFWRRGFNGVLIIKHSRYLGSFSMFTSSCYICSGSLSEIISWQGTPYKFRASLLAPLSSKALTGLVDLRSGTALIAKWRGVYPA